MKKYLLGTSAIVGASAVLAAPASAEDPIRLGLDGYMNMFFGVGSTDNDAGFDREPTNLFQDGEIWFVGETTLDNGISFGVNVQLEAFSSSDQIDESFGYVEGSFGRINLGSENTAAYLMQYSAPSVGVPINTGWITTFIPADGVGGPVGAFRTPVNSTFVDFGNDERIVTYFTPRFAGFQVGASYTPNIVGTGDGSVQPADNQGLQHGISVGVNYVNSFGGVDLAVAGGYRLAQQGDDVPGDPDDPQLFSAGLNVGFSGFTIGGSIAIEDSDRETDGTGWDAGASYSTGPWTVGATVLSSEVDGDNLETLAIEGGLEYAIGPGITGSLSVLFAEFESDTGDADGVVGVVGLAYSF